MYSLGVIFFELWHPPFSTGMERAETLLALRKGLGFPKPFERAVPLEAKNIINWLLQPDPSKRPLAEQLLTSPLLPARGEVEEGCANRGLVVCLT